MELVIQFNYKTFFPETGVFGTEIAHISSPDDLIGITNAKDVFSVDYYRGEERISAALATKTEGSIYDHSKVICDRLNSSKLLDVRYVSLKGHEVIYSKIERASGEIEYALSFSIRQGIDQNELYSLWNIEKYPEGNYMNFQVWGGRVILSIIL